MTGVEVGAVELVVGVAVVLVAAAALLAPGRLASVVTLLVMGVLLSVLWALAGAPDVALAEAAIGTGVTGMLFIDTVTRSRTRRRADGDGSPEEDRTGTTAASLWVPGAALTLVAATVLTAGLAPALQRAADPLEGAAPGLARPVLDVVPAIGVDHPVTAVLLNLRSYDTLLEVLVLLVAAVVVLAVTVPAPGGPEADRTGAGVAPLQRAATLMLVPVLALVASWVLFAGSSRTGGAFQAGAVAAAAFVLLRLAGRRSLAPHGRGAALLLVAGPAAFLTVAVAGPVLGRGWLELAPTGAGTVIVLLETVLAVSIGASLAAVALAVRAPTGAGRTPGPGQEGP